MKKAFIIYMVDNALIDNINGGFGMAITLHPLLDGVSHETLEEAEERLEIFMSGLDDHLSSIDKFVILPVYSLR